jgi:hypothetical protein
MPLLKEEAPANIVLISVTFVRFGVSDIVPSRLLHPSKALSIDAHDIVPH